MITVQSAVTPHAGATLWLRPNRSLTRQGVRHWQWALGVLVIGFALICAHGGNVFAPAFGLIDAAAVICGLKLAWKATCRSERITVDERTLAVENLPGHARVEFIAYWVRVNWRAGHGYRRLVLTSHGREHEVGAFLAEEEREQLARKLKTVLADMKAPRHAQDQSTQG